MSVSDLEMMRGATPERSTGRAYKDSTLREAAGLAFWFLARPAGSTEYRALVWDVILFWIWWMFPEVDLMIPTCSAVSTKLIGVVPMEILEVSF